MTMVTITLIVVGAVLNAVAALMWVVVVVGIEESGATLSNPLSDRDWGVIAALIGGLLFSLAASSIFLVAGTMVGVR